jgi:pilus assembly protein Flp/PilA
MKKFLLKFSINDAAATAIEYGLIVAGVAAVVVTAVQLIGTNMSSTLNIIASSFQ